MAGLTKLVKHLKKGEALVITPRIERWLIQHPGGVVLDEDALDLLRQIGEQAKVNDVRSARFGASSRGTCHRQQVFAFLGMPTEGMRDPTLQNIFNDGTFRHLRWQLMGMQAGVFTHVEYPIEIPHLRVRTALDGLNADDQWFFELKGAANWTSNLEGVPDKHLLQIHTCMIATGWDMCVYVMEDKRTQQWREMIVRRDPRIMNQVKKELAILNEAVEARRLPRILPECQAKKGAYTSCPYRQHCLAQEDWHGNDWPEEGQWPE